MKRLIGRIQELTMARKMIWRKFSIWPDKFFYDCECRGLNIVVYGKSMGGGPYLRIRTTDVFGKYTDTQELICDQAEWENLTAVIEATDPPSFDALKVCRRIKDHRDLADKVFDLISR